MTHAIDLIQYAADYLNVDAQRAKITAAIESTKEQAAVTQEKVL